ncbi:MAG: hypothetical protein RLP44_18425 [Aggregatilineales bacterium]
MDKSTAPEFSSRRIWFAFTGSAIVWTGHFVAIWFLGEVGCLGGLGNQTVLGINLIFGLSLIVTLLALILAVASGAIAYRIWQQVNELETQDEIYASHERQRFMALFGMLAATLFTVAILVQTAPLFVIPIC